MRKVHMDYAVKTPLDRKTFEAMKPYSTEAYGNASSINSFEPEAEQTLEAANGSLRLPHYKYNTDENGYYILEVLPSTVERLRRKSLLVTVRHLIAK